MATFVRDPSGAYFIKGSAGLQAVTDPATIKGLSSQQIPFENQAYTSFNPIPQVQAPSQSNPTLTNSGQPAAPQSLNFFNNTNTNDPLTKFNLSVMDMLSRAQGQDSQNLFTQQRALQRAQLGQVSQETPEELKILSPSQQSAIRQGGAQALEPEIDAVASAIKARDQRLSNFEKILGTVKDMGGDLAKNISPSPEIIEGYRKVIRAGGDITSVPSEIRNKVLTKLNDDDYQVGKQARISEKLSTQTSAGGGDDIKEIADAIIRGELAPTTTGFYGKSAAIKAELARRGFNVAKAELEWNATKKFVDASNSTQQVRLRQAEASVEQGLDNLEKLNSEFKRYGMTWVNKAQLAVLGTGLGEQAKVAQQFLTQLALITDEMGNVFMGGNSPTDKALDLASSVFKKDFTKDQLDAAISTLRDNLGYRKISWGSVGPNTSVTGGTSRYAEQKSGAGLSEEVRVRGYDYEAMKADGYSDEEIKSAVGL